MTGIEKELDNVVSSLLFRAQEEREQSEPYQNLWEATDEGLRGLLSEAHHQMERVVLDVATVIQKKFNLPVLTDELYGLIMALPFAMHELREDIEKKDGRTCCADKTRHLYFKAVTEAIERAKNTQK